MSAHTKKPTTSAFAEFTLRVPAQAAEQVRKVLDGLLPLIGGEARLSKKKPNTYEPDTYEEELRRIIAESEADDDGSRYAAEDVLGVPTPGQLLKGLRAREGITQKELADALGIQQHHVSEMEKGTRKIGLAMAKRIAKAYGVSHRVFV